MDPNLLAFILSGCFGSIAFLVLFSITRSRKRPPNDDEMPKGPVTIGV